MRAAHALHEAHGVEDQKEPHRHGEQGEGAEIEAKGIAKLTGIQGGADGGKPEGIRQQRPHGGGLGGVEFEQDGVEVAPLAGQLLGDADVGDEQLLHGECAGDKGACQGEGQWRFSLVKGVKTARLADLPAQAAGLGAGQPDAVLPLMV